MWRSLILFKLAFKNISALDMAPRPIVVITLAVEEAGSTSTAWAPVAATYVDMATVTAVELEHRGNLTLEQLDMRE